MIWLKTLQYYALDFMTVAGRIPPPHHNSFSTRPRCQHCCFLSQQHRTGPSRPATQIDRRHFFTHRVVDMDPARRLLLCKLSFRPTTRHTTNPQSGKHAAPRSATPFPKQQARHGPSRDRKAGPPISSAEWRHPVRFGQRRSGAAASRSGPPPAPTWRRIMASLAPRSPRQGARSSFAGEGRTFANGHLRGRDLLQADRDLPRHVFDLVNNSSTRSHG